MWANMCHLVFRRADHINNLALKAKQFTIIWSVLYFGIILKKKKMLVADIRLSAIFDMHWVEGKKPPQDKKENVLQQGIADFILITYQ